MSKKKGKAAVKQEPAPVNRYRKMALVLNPVILAILVLCILAGMPPEVVLSLAIVGYAIWGCIFMKARAEDRKNR